MIRLRGISEGRSIESFEFDPASGEFERTLHTSYEEASAGACGFGDLREIGLRKREKVFVAFYSLDGIAHLSIPPQHFAWPGPYVARRRSCLGRMKSFSITSNVRKYLHFYYTFVDSSHGFPGPEVVDIFYMVASETSNERRLRSFIYFWEAHSAGVDVAGSSFQKELAEIERSG
jgi:hypothetical protein